jgi:RHH-type rel operon transcriptional repressor/antitoxin RelB
MSATMTIRLDDALKERLEKLASATHRSKSFLAAEAVKEFVELNEWQIQEIQAAMIEADKGEFAADSDVEQLRAKWS